MYNNMFPIINKKIITMQLNAYGTLYPTENDFCQTWPTDRPFSGDTVFKFGKIEMNCKIQNKVRSVHIPDEQACGIHILQDQVTLMPLQSPCNKQASAMARLMSSTTCYLSLVGQQSLRSLA